MRLRETAADQQAVHGRQAGIPQGVDHDQARPGLFQGLQIAGIIKTEGGVAQDANAQVRGVTQRRRDRHRQGRGLGRHGPQTGEVDLGADLCSNGGDTGIGVGVLVARYQAQMALGQQQGRLALHRAEHREIGVILHSTAQLVFMTLAADFIENHPSNARVRLEAPVTE